MPLDFHLLPNIRLQLWNCRVLPNLHPRCVTQLINCWFKWLIHWWKQALVVTPWPSILPNYSTYTCITYWCELLDNNKFFTFIYLLEATHDEKLTNSCRNLSPGHLIWHLFNHYYLMGINTYFWNIWTKKLVSRFMFCQLSICLTFHHVFWLITIFIFCMSVAQCLWNIRMDNLGTAVCSFRLIDLICTNYKEIIINH